MAKTIKIFVLGILGTLLTSSSFYFLKNSLTSSNFGGLWLFFSGIVLFLILIAVESVVIRELKWLISLVLVESIAPILLFSSLLFSANHLILIGGGLMVIFMLWGVLRGRFLLDNSVKIKFLFITRRVIPKVATGIIVFGVIIFYLYFFQFNYFSQNVASGAFNGILNSAEPLVRIWMPGLSFDMTVDQAISKITEVMAKKSNPDLVKQGVDFDKLPDSLRNNLLSGASLKVKGVFKNLGIEAGSDKTLRQALFEAVRGKLNGLSGQTTFLIEIAVVAVIFFILRGVTTLIYPLIAFLSFLLFKFFMFTGFSFILLESVRQEKLEM